MSWSYTGISQKKIPQEMSGTRSCTNFHPNQARPKRWFRWSREHMGPSNRGPLGLCHAFNSKEGQWHMQQTHLLRTGTIPAFCCLAHMMVEDSIRREGVPPAWQTCTKAVEPISESQQRTGTAVSHISSERKTDLPTQRVESDPWKPSVIEMVRGSHQQWDRHWHLCHIVHKRL